jgi:hypothetical protein
LEKILKSIEELAVQVNVDEIEKDTNESKQKSEDLNRKVEQVEGLLPLVLNEYNKTLNTYEEEKNKTSVNEEKLIEFNKKNANLDDELKIVSGILLLEDF